VASSTENTPPTAARTSTEPLSNEPPLGAMSFANTDTCTALPNDVDTASAAAHGPDSGYATSRSSIDAVWVPPAGFAPDA